MYICNNPEISEAERIVIREELEAMYCDRMDVYQKTEITDEKTHLTSFENELVLEGIPCRISEQNVSTATKGEPARASRRIRVILAPEIEIPPGSMIKVSHHGHTGKFRQSGEAYIKSDTQTIELEFEDYA